MCALRSGRISFISLFRKKYVYYRTDDYNRWWIYMSVIKIRSNIRDYTVFFEGAGKALSEIEKRCPNRCCIIDANVWAIYENSLSASLKNDKPLILPIDEEKMYKHHIKDMRLSY